MVTPVASAQPIPGARSRAARAAGGRKDPSDHERDADGADRREPLVEDGEGHHRHERHAGAPRDGVDGGQVARAIRPAEREEVHGVQQHGGGDERQRGGTEPAGPQEVEPAGQVQDRAEGARPPEERQRVARRAWRARSTPRASAPRRSRGGGRPGPHRSALLRVTLVGRPGLFAQALIARQRTGFSDRDKAWAPALEACPAAACRVGLRRASGPGHVAVASEREGSITLP